MWRSKVSEVSLEAGTVKPNNLAAGGHRDFKTLSSSYIWYNTRVAKFLENQILSLLMVA